VKYHAWDGAVEPFGALYRLDDRPDLPSVNPFAGFANRFFLDRVSLGAVAGKRRGVDRADQCPRPPCRGQKCRGWVGFRA